MGKKTGTHDEYMMVTGDSFNKLYLYSTTISAYPQLTPGCRFPEVQDVSKKKDYCDISNQHTMCKFKTAAPGCNPSEFGLSSKLKEALVEKLNRERRIIANTPKSGENPLPAAANMRKISWDDELARIAQLWALQCNMELDNVRIALIDKLEVTFGQNIARFEFSSHLDLSENRVKKLIDYWANSYDAEVVNLIDSFQFKASENEYNHNYFTQMAWALTDRIGCGYARYKEDGKDEETSVFVCNFAAEGNLKNQPVYKKGPACGDCGQGYECEPNLKDGSKGSLCVKS